jgi:murein DD-endopeptidase MepM/ murein hydrolase activator NlpD
VYFITSCNSEKQQSSSFQDARVFLDSVFQKDSLEKIALSQSYVRSSTVQFGQGFFQVLKEMGVETSKSLELINGLRFHVELGRIRVGDSLIVYMTPEDSGNVRWFEYKPNVAETHRLTFQDSTGKYVYSEDIKPTEHKYRLIEGNIVQGSSLHQTLLAQGVPEHWTAVINGVLLCKISFRTDARAGDRYRALVEEEWYKNTLILGKVLYASYEGKKTGFYEAFRYHDKDPKSSYNAHYTEDGEALVHSGLRYPVNRLHISSNYGWRVHPVTGQYKMHYGVDYAAPTGSSVYAVASGTVVLSGYDKYSGNKVAIRHADGSRSYYLHLHRRLVTKGQNVRSRQLIGTVGATGRVTGPHLHFGFKTPKGKWMNPLKKRMIATPKLRGERLESLQEQISQIREALQKATVEKASLENTTGSTTIIVDSNTYIEDSL